MSQINLLNLCVAHEVLMFGEFTLKSGRLSPYFFNTGNFNRGNLLAAIGNAFAELLVARIHEPYMLYGPAYKGIPLVAATAVQLASRYNIQVPYAFNRKEAKDHGEGGTTAGAALNGRVIILDDVITAGLSVAESVAIIRNAGATPHAICIALDRQELATGETRSATEKIAHQYQIPVHALIRLDDLIDYLGNTAELTQHLPAVQAYRTRYGAGS